MQREEDVQRGELNPYARQRVQKTVGGVVVTVGAVIVAVAAYFKGDYVFILPAFAVGLVGAGIMHPSVLQGYFKKSNGGG